MIIILVCALIAGCIAGYGWIEWYQEQYEEKLRREDKKHQALMKEIRRQP